ncbi:hypothetical protein BDV06DRAFT_70045 [Aspergillus oleicola]
MDRAFRRERPLVTRFLISNAAVQFASQLLCLILGDKRESWKGSWMQLWLFYCIFAHSYCRWLQNDYPDDYWLPKGSSSNSRSLLGGSIYLVYPSFE